jgi:hypothetical protein
VSEGVGEDDLFEGTGLSEAVEYRGFPSLYAPRILAASYSSSSSSCELGVKAPSRCTNCLYRSLRKYIGVSGSSSDEFSGVRASGRLYKSTCRYGEPSAPGLIVGIVFAVVHSALR